MTLRTALDQDRRLALLQVLAQGGGTANDRMLMSVVERLGHRPSSDLLTTELAWLAEQGLIETEQVETFTVATITRRGEDVAAGRATVPGVRRPRADERG